MKSDVKNDVKSDVFWTLQHENQLEKWQISCFLNVFSIFSWCTIRTIFVDVLIHLTADQEATKKDLQLVLMEVIGYGSDDALDFLYGQGFASILPQDNSPFWFAIDRKRYIVAKAILDAIVASYEPEDPPELVAMQSALRKIHS